MEERLSNDMNILKYLKIWGCKVNARGFKIKEKVYSGLEFENGEFSFKIQLMEFIFYLELYGTNEKSM